MIRKRKRKFKIGDTVKTNSGKIVTIINLCNLGDMLCYETSSANHYYEKELQALELPNLY